jgi:hypothetical protein
MCHVCGSLGLCCRRSLMPEGLLDALQDKQVADLLAYLMTLKG